MEKLLVTINHTDGYTYSSEETLPVIFNSKEEFLIIFEDIIQIYIDENNKFNKELKFFHDKHQTAWQNFSNYNAKLERSKINKKNTPLNSKTLDELQAAIQERDYFIENNKPLNTFDLGGQTFSHNDFITINEDKKDFFYLSLPLVETIDEFFLSVKTSLENNQDIKTKSPKI